MNDNFEEILNQLKANIYMTDIETHKILFMNRKMKEDYGFQYPEGKVCWEVLQQKEGQEAPCGFCRIKQLSEPENKGRTIRWKEDNQRLKKIIDRYDSLISWKGKLVHMQESYDVTEFFRLTEQKEKDALCQVWNRKKGKSMLEERLKGMKESGCSYLMVLLDIDGVKEVNEIYGYSEGDFLIKHIIKTLESFMADTDFIFRLSGDEFVLVLQDIKEKEARKLLTEWRGKAEELKEVYGKPYETSFSYGMCFADKEHEIQVNDMIAKADERMYEEKLRRRKNQLFDENPFCTEKVKIKKMEYPTQWLYEALVHSTDDYIYICNMKSGIFRYSPAQVEMFELPGEVVENPLPYWKRIVHPDDWERFYKSNMEIGENKIDYHTVEFRAKKRSGEYVWLKCRGQLIRDEYGNPSLFAGIMVQMGKQNKVDPLTQLLNHEEFKKALENKIEETMIEYMAVLILDVDEFRQINELYNREFGDAVLKILGQAIQSMLPGNASLYRLENDRLGILLENGSQQDAAMLYQNMQKTLLKIHQWKQEKLSVELSAGCSMYPKNGKTVEELYRYADYALQHAKAKGKNRLEFFSEDIMKIKLRSIEIFRQLKDSTMQGYRGFYLNYQPQVNAVSGEITGVEALMRWRDTDGRQVSPMEFIPIMEEHGMIYGTGLWTLRTAVRTGKQWIKNRPDFMVSVNISALQLLEEHFLEDLYAVVEEEKFPGENLVLELTESYTVKNIRIFQEKFNEMRRKGIRIAMDDFGTGYSSLEILKNAPVDIVKIDRTFVKDILHSRFDATFISFVVAICHDVNIKVCLEGVETEKEYELVQKMQLDCIQGYYFGKPVSENEITERLGRVRG